MNLHEARVVLRPRRLHEIGDLTLRFLAREGPAFARGVAPLGVATCLAVALLRQLTGGSGWKAGWACALLVAYLGTGFFTLLGSELLFARAADIGSRSLVRRSLGALPKLWLLDLVRLIVLSVGTASVVALPWAASRTVLAREAVLLEGASLGDALGRSRALTRSHAARATGLLLASLVVRLTAVAVCEGLGQAVTNDLLQLGHPFGALVREGGSYFALIGLVLSSPLVACFSFFTYVDQRTRKEGWDIQLAFVAGAAWLEEAGHADARAPRDAA